MIKFLQKLAVVSVKNAKIFAKFFGETIFKIIKSVPVRKTIRDVVFDMFPLIFHRITVTKLAIKNTVRIIVFFEIIYRFSIPFFGKSLKQELPKLQH
jgi:hypothetical protein